MVIVAIVLLTLVIGKAIWVSIATRDIYWVDTEEADILRRRDFLMEKVITNPQKLIDRMPSTIGEQFRGEWAMYTCSMFSAALVNIAQWFPETETESKEAIEKLIEIVLSPELRRYDAYRWDEDPLENLDGDKSHISYLSILAWMIGGYKVVGGDDRYDSLYHSICEAMNRRLLDSPAMNLETFPGEYVYIPDMLVAVVALSEYSRLYDGKYEDTVKKWLSFLRENSMDRRTGLIPSAVPYDYAWNNFMSINGSYTALSCYYLTFIDEGFAKEQYELLKKHFLKHFPTTGFKEYMNKSPLLAMDIDAGPILFGLSPSGTAFGIGPATYFGDMDLRYKLLKTAERAGFTITINGKRHYLLADFALVGEAITLAMRTACPWNHGMLLRSFIDKR